NRNRGDDRADVRLENVGAHAPDVADIVAHVLRDRCGVARAVLANARLDLAEEVRTNVGCPRVDAATDAGEERDRAGTHAEAADDAGKPDEITVGNGARTLEEEPDADAEQAERCDREAPDCAAEER